MPREKKDQIGDVDQKIDLNIRSNAKYIENPNNIKLYSYPNGKRCCGLGKVIEELIKEEIKKIILTAESLEIDCGKLGIIMNTLSQLIDNRVSEAHQAGQETYPIFTFKEIKEKIDNPIELEEHYKAEVKRCFYLIWDDFKSKCDVNTDKNLEILTWLNDIVNSLTVLSIDEFIDFLKYISVHKKYSEDIDLYTIGKIINDSDLKNFYFYCLLNAKNQNFSLEKSQYNHNSTKYFLSTITERAEDIKSIIGEIMCKNEKIFFENDFIITDRIEYKENNVRKELGDENFSMEKEKFTKLQYEFIKLEDAVKNLNQGVGI